MSRFQGTNTYLDNPLENPLEYTYNYTYTYTYDPLPALDPLASLSNSLVHGASFPTIQEELHKIENPSNRMLEDILVLMFKTRDVRGNGERCVFRNMFSALYTMYPDLLSNMLVLIPQYGYWKDFFYLALTNYGLLQPAMAIAYRQLLADERALDEGRPVSLLAKWIPKEGKSLGHFAKSFANYIYSNSDMSYSQQMSLLRRRIVRLNAALKTVESLECANRWDEINPADVPSIAARRSRSAFMNEIPHKNQIRRPNDSKRMVCRAKFENYRAPLRTQVDESRYHAVRERSMEYFAGLNTTHPL